MSVARTAIFGDIARGLGRTPLDPAARATVGQRIAARARNTVPARGHLPATERRDLFVAMAQAMGATVDRVGSTDAVPDTVADYLARHNLPTDLILSPDPALKGLPWQRRPLLAVKNGVPWPSDMVGVALAVAGVAETGTLVLHSGAHASTSLNFTPDTHIVVLHGGTVVGAYEDAFDLLRAATGDAWPRTVNLITGPSRTADIEQTLVMGAHGPRRLHVILVENQAA